MWPLSKGADSPESGQRWAGEMYKFAGLPFWITYPSAWFQEHTGYIIGARKMLTKTIKKSVLPQVHRFAKETGEGTANLQYAIKQFV